MLNLKHQKKEGNTFIPSELNRVWSMNYHELKNQLIHLNNQYHINSVSVVTDAEYDKMLIQLKAMEKAQGFADPDSPTQTIGAVIKHGRKVKHSEKMYSLDNVFSNNELNAFFSKHPNEIYICEPKIDGMSGNLVYKQGKLIIAASRGDGLIGENITENVMVIDNIPKEVDRKEDFEIRGEFVISKKDFISLNEKRATAGLDQFKTARNLVSGTMRGLNPNDVIERSVKFYAYGSPSWKDLDYIPKRKIIEEMGFSHVTSLIIDELDKVEFIAQTIKNAEKEYPYEIDGVVIKLNSAALQASLGYTSKDPKWAVARKWNSEGIIVEVIDIENQIGRTGVITPVAKIPPTIIGGVEVTSATLHNYEQIKEMEIGIGSKIRIIRSGDVIPKVEGVVKEEKTPHFSIFEEPKKCPVCNSDTMFIGAKLYCSNNYCFGQKLAYLNYFVSRQAMNINDLSEQTIKQLVYKGFVREPADLYRVTKKNLLALDGFADKSAEKLLQSIENSKTPSLDKFIVSLGIDNVGIKTASSLAKRFNCIENLIKATKFDLIEINDIGDKTSDEIIDYFKNKDNLKQINDLLQYVKPTYTSNNSGDELTGKTFVITGSFEVDRKQIGDVLEAYGAKVSGSVSSKTTLLIQGENPGDNKVTAAIKNNVPMVDYSGKSLSDIIDSIFIELKLPKPNQPF